MVGKNSFIQVLSLATHPPRGVQSQVVGKVTPKIGQGTRNDLQAIAKLPLGEGGVIKRALLAFKDITPGVFYA